ncbi:MAG: GLPGLI family protein [Flavobacteriia bacterium]|jgi:GLPGLI family protein|nr:GLPGLI family protein [Cryomorphaceae bacterium]
MISRVGIKQFISALCIALFPMIVSAQMTSGRIVFERKTNLKKRMGDNPRMKNFITEENKYRIENFELFFNDSTCLFRPLPDNEPVEGFLKYFTTRNTVYQDISSQHKYIIMDLWGTEAIISDSIDQRNWKVTDSKRNISGYSCRKAIFQMNDSTRIYAWFSIDVVPSIGPEGFGGLPGAILGLASEDGGVVYFAKEVKAMAPPAGVMSYNEKGKEVYTEEQLKKMLMERMGQWVKPKDLEAMFSWL